ncbi:hypothetical protein DB347_20580 [Opitutaceae bacterium EW11]|nr:hypothetical protein DB347_20580 [Opitutaceae bacterium EW11]
MHAQHSVADAVSFVRNIPLTPQTFGPGKSLLAPRAVGFNPATEQNQSVVVGSEVQVFAHGVEQNLRRAMMHSALIAQLAATARVPQQNSREDFAAWYEVYFATLNNLGWVLADHRLGDYEGVGSVSEVHQAVLALAAGLLGGTASLAYRLVAASIEALRDYKGDAPWFTIFNRQVQRKRVAAFQVSAAELDSLHGGLSVALMAYQISSQRDFTQVLLFKFAHEHLSFEQWTSHVAIEESFLMETDPAIYKRIREYIPGYIAQLELPPI